jgi:hypothetical protein
MRVLLVRVGTDSTVDGGGWNAPVDSRTGLFAYVPIPEKRRVRPGAERPYSLFADGVSALGGALPDWLLSRHAHVDPDFEHLTYGHPSARARRIRACGCGDVLANAVLDAPPGQPRTTHQRCCRTDPSSGRGAGQPPGTPATPGACRQAVI